MRAEIQKAFDQVEKDPDFWGSVEVSFKAGKPQVVHVSKTTILNNRENLTYASNQTRY